MACPEARTIGVWPATSSGKSCSICSPSAAVSVLDDPAPICIPPERIELGKIITRLLPIELIELFIWCDAPFPMAITAITAAMPTMMPSAVSRLRTLLRQIARSATRKIMMNDMAVCCALEEGNAGSGGFGRIGVRRDLRRRQIAVVGDATVLDHDPALGKCRNVILVGDHHNGDAPAVQLLQELDDLHR